ncbi:MAG: glycosyltransferase [Bacteroidales bacterium]|nr:glycosyltransferase [Bacteroidales bacterium]
MAEKIIIIGPAYPYRGGIAAFNERLATELIAEGHQVELVTFTLQYPSFLFPGKTQYSDGPAPEKLQIERMINSINPFNWLKVGKVLRKKKADLIIFAFWLPYMAPALGTIARLCKTRTVGLIHNLIPHEHKPGDRMFAKYFCKGIDRFAALSNSVAEDIRNIVPGKRISMCPHPLYDNFGSPVSREDACARLGIDPGSKILLSFGLIRDYKGLDWLLEAFASLKERSGVKLVVAGEFYADGEKYHRLARDLGIDNEVIWKTEFVPDSEVKYYFCAADLIVQPYKTATQSGVTQIAYHFEKPMLVTRVGGLSEIVPDKKVGYAVEPSPKAVADALKHYLQDTPDFTEGIREEKQKYSWKKMAESVMAY